MFHVCLYEMQRWIRANAQISKVWLAAARGLRLLSSGRRTAFIVFANQKVSDVWSGWVGTKSYEKVNTQPVSSTAWNSIFYILLLVSKAWQGYQIRCEPFCAKSYGPWLWSWISKVGFYNIFSSLLELPNLKSLGRLSEESRSSSITSNVATNAGGRRFG